MALTAISHPALAQVAPRMTIDSIPSGATVYIDGAPQGQSGPGFKVRITKGQHKIRLELEGHKTFETMANISTAQKLTYPLEKAPARLDIKFPATNDGAKGGEVFVDGAPAGVVPVLVDLPPGRHLIEVRKQGQKSYTETVEIRAAETKPVWVSMQADQRVGSLLVAADVSADVLVDGQPRGQAPMLVDNLNEGEHLVEVRRAEPGAPPWRQTVRVAGNQQTKVFAQTTPPPPAQGSLMVMCNVPDVEVTIDGQLHGSAGKPINLPPGQHVVMVQARGYKLVTKPIDIEAGKPRVERIDLEGDNATRKVATVRIIMANPVEGAQYFINGRKLDETAALSDQGIEVPAGQVILVVKKEGFGLTRKEFNLVAGTVETVQVELRNVGRVYFATEPKGAYVVLDKNLIGQTPLTKESVSAGPHTFELQMQGMETIADTIQVIAGDVTNVSVIMKPPPPRPIDRIAVMRQLSSFSAIVHDPGHFTADISGGYPYFVNARLTVGALKAKSLLLGIVGLDIGAQIRTNLYSDTNVGANVRFQYLQKGPFALGLSMFVGGGGGPRDRNTFSFELGLPITLIAGDIVKLTVRPYLQVNSDRNCPAVDTLKALYMTDQAGFIALGDPRDGKGAEHSGDLCVGRGSANGINPIYDAVAYQAPPNYMGVGTMVAQKYNPAATQYQVDGVGILERFTVARFMLQAVFEVALSHNANLFAILEGAPLQRERQLFTDKFNRFYPETDLGVYGQLGFSLKY